jgi:hypothetical protein
MGIRNDSFILALVNPKLKGIDPFDPNLTIEEIAAIAIECRINPWFYFRECCRIPGLGKNEPDMLESNRGNIALFWLFFNHVMLILIQPRQTGKSVSTDALMNYLLNILCQNTAINLMTLNDTLRRANVDRLKRIGEELPLYLQQRTRDDLNNMEQVSVKSLDNTYTTHVAQMAEKSALKMGRGLTSPIFHIDEGPYHPNIRLALPTALASMGAAADAAKRQGTPYGTILTTTAGKKDDADGAFIYKMLSESANWTEKFFDCKDIEDLHATIRRNSHGGVCRINATFDHKQLGKTDQWLREKLEQTTMTGEEADRDYFNRWTSGSQTHPLAVTILEKISNSYMSHLYTDISKPHGYITRWYIPEDEIEERMKTGRFVLGMDTSEASGRDDISLVLIDADTLDVVAAGTFNETNLIKFAEWVCSILVTYSNITAIIEKRSTGVGLLDYLLHWLPQYGIDPFKRLFNWVVNDPVQYKDYWKEIQVPIGRRSNDIYDRLKNLFGFSTSGSGATSRTGLYTTTLQNAAKRGCEKIHDKDLIDQIKGLVTRNGRIDHPVGEHDDMVIGWLLANWLLHQGKNLSFYGIDKVMTSFAPKPIETPLETERREEQQYIRERIDELYNLLTEEDDDFITLQMEHELRMLSRRLILEVGEIYSLDNLIKQAKEKKRTRRRGYQYGQNNSVQPDNVYFNPAGCISSEPLSEAEIIRRQ